MADGGLCGKNLMWWLEDDGTLTISGKGAMYDYDFDASPWDDSRELIEKIIINHGVTTIGVSAFWRCENLTSVTISDTVTTIDYGAFYKCKSLVNVTIPDSVTTIDDSAFIGCTSLTNVTIPDSVTEIDDEVFDGCTSLKEIHYPAGRGFEKQLSQGNNAKLIPYNVTPPVNEPTTQPKFHPVQPTKPQPKFYPVQTTAQPVAEKLTWSFAGKTLTVGGVREIKFFPYGQIPWLKHLHDIQRIVVGEGVEKIAAQAFEECKRLEMVTLPASVKTIGDMFASVAFCGDKSVNGGKNVFWCLEDGVLVLKKNPAAVGDDFSTGFASWIFADKNIHGVKLETSIKPTENFFAWLSSHDGAAISFE